MALFPQTFIDDIRLQANILTIIQEYVPLKRAGNTYKGLCPFHSEKSPSFTVNPEKGFFHCFGCNAGGDVFKFVELHEKIGFHESVRMLAQKVGLSLPEMAETDDGRRDAVLREGLLKAHEVAAAYFREQLTGNAGARARQQLKERDVAPETIDGLGIGFAPAAREGLKARLRSQGFTEALLLQSGLVVKRESGEIVDRFRNRLMLPICRESGSVIAFGGRQMDADQGGPKYLNSPETPIYSKGRTLYGLHLAKPAIRKLGYALMVEGYFDLAQVYQSDVFKQSGAPVIASSGTALTASQAQLLRRFTTNVKLNFDPDNAGQAAATRSCELLVHEGFEVKVVILDKGEDPDNFLRRHGSIEYRDRLRDARPYLDYVVAHEASGLNFAVAEQRSRYLEKMQRFANVLPDEASKDVLASKVASITGIADDTIVAQFRKAFRGIGVAAASIVPRFKSLKDAEKGLISALIHNTSEALRALDELEPEDLEGLGSREILEAAQTLKDSADRLPALLLSRLSSESSQMVTGIATKDFPHPTPEDCVSVLKKNRLERQLAGIQREFDRLQHSGADPHGNQIDALWQKKKDLLHRIEELT